ncbi:MAG: hypothetical protein JXB48_06090 [Candidatus Latescibacteria bacterium]|nr:hypothetical protein [Candidatus Latescibacterota bacterium]
MQQYRNSTLPWVKNNIIVFLMVLSSIFSTPEKTECQQHLVKILVTSPHIGAKEYRAVADVLAGSIIRELNRHGGLEIVDREASEKYLRDKGLDEWVNNRDIAIEVGEALGADIVIYSSLGRNYDTFVYSIAFLEVERDIIQRIVQGSFSETDPPARIGRLIRNDMTRLSIFIPTPSELADPGINLREQTVDPDVLPKKMVIEEFPNMGMYGIMEQILTYYRVFPGEIEYMKFEQQRNMTRLQFRDDMDSELTELFNKFRIYADFAIRHNMQVYFIKDCSIRAVNVLLANKIPVLFSPNGEGMSVLVGYGGLRADGYSYFIPYGTEPFEAYDFTHRQRVAVMIILPKAGRKGGISRQYLESAIGRYRDEWDKSPQLVEIKEGFLDILSTSLD